MIFRTAGLGWGVGRKGGVLLGVRVYDAATEKYKSGGKGGRDEKVGVEWVWRCAQETRGSPSSRAMSRTW